MEDTMNHLHTIKSDPVMVALPTQQPRWYAAYTTARHEKRVAEQLERKSVECFLPLYEAVHRWKDRKARVRLPLFPGYVFVRIPLRERLRVLEIPSVVHLVGTTSQPTELPDLEIDSLRSGLHALRIEPCPYLKVGDRVRVKYGPLAGLEGILLRKRDSFRLVLSIDIIMRSVAVEIDAADIESAR
jgi:transcription antitermination factor NusG